MNYITEEIKNKILKTIKKSYLEAKAVSNEEMSVIPLIDTVNSLHKQKEFVENAIATQNINKEELLEEINKAIQVGENAISESASRAIIEIELRKKGDIVKLYNKLKNKDYIDDHLKKMLKKHAELYSEEMFEKE